MDVKVKFLVDHGPHKEGATADMPLSEARRLAWAGVVAEQGRGGSAVSAAAPAAGTVDEVLASVGDDPAAAQAALEAEQAKGDAARKSLVERLQAIAAQE